MTFWRSLMLTFLAALIAGGIGGWIGARGALDEDS